MQIQSNEGQIKYTYDKLGPDKLGITFHLEKSGEIDSGEIKLKNFINKKLYVSGTDLVGMKVLIYYML